MLPFLKGRHLKRKSGGVVGTLRMESSPLFRAEYVICMVERAAIQLQRKISILVDSREEKCIFCGFIWYIKWKVQVRRKVVLEFNIVSFLGKGPSTQKKVEMRMSLTRMKGQVLFPQQVHRLGHLFKEAQFFNFYEYNMLALFKICLLLIIKFSYNQFGTRAALPPLYISFMLFEVSSILLLFELRKFV